MDMLKDLESRFEEKAYSEAEMYYRLKEGLFPGDFYRACIINFQNFAKDFPESKRNEELAYRLVEVGYTYAKNSAFDKKEDRLNDALKFATNFYRKYPASGYLAEVKKFEEQTKEEVQAHSKLKKEIADKKAAEEAVVTTNSN
jgi:outer membrane protein assembly factor BamD